MALRDIYSRFANDEDRPFESFDRAHREDVIAPQSLLSILWRRKRTIVVAVVLSLFGGIFYIAITPPRYLASTAILIDPRLGKTVGSDPVQPGFIVDTSAMDSQIKLLLSQTVLERTAKIADLIHDPEFNGSDRSLLQRLLHPETALEHGVDLKALETAITIKRPERTYVVGVDVLAKNPEKAADIANALTKAYIEDQVTSRIDAAQDDTKFIGTQLAELSTELKAAEDKVEAFKTQHNVVDATGLRSNEQQVIDLTKALGEARARTSDTKAKYDEIQRLQSQGRLDSSSEAIKSMTMERLRQSQAETEQNVAKLAMTLGPRHPELLEARSRARRLDKLIRDELHRLARSAAADYRSAKDHETQIATEVDRLKGTSARLSSNLVPLDQLERNVKVLRASYERYAHIRDNIGQQEADSPPARVIGIARPSVSPAQPKKSVVAIISLSAGLFFGLAAALFAESTSPPPHVGSPLPFDGQVPPRQRRSPRPRSARRYWDDDDV